MRADEHADAAVGCAFKQAGALVIGRGTREQAPGDAHFVEPLPQRRGMLAREHLGGRHERRLGARIGHRGKGEGRDGGFARAHVAEQHVVGRLGRRHAREDIRTSLLLLLGKGERHDAVERRRARAIHHMRRRLRAGGALRGLRHERELEQQQLLVHQAAARFGDLSHGMREMDARQRGAAGHEPIPHAQIERQRIIAALHGIERVSHQTAHPRGRDLLACGMHGDDHALGHLAVAELLDIGVHHALEAVVELHLAGDGDAHAGFDLVFQPRLAKASDHEHAGCVHHRDLDEREVGARALELDLVDRPLDSARPADARAGDGLTLRQVYIASGEVREQVADRAHAQTRKRLRASRADQLHARRGFI